MHWAMLQWLNGELTKISTDRAARRNISRAKCSHPVMKGLHVLTLSLAGGGLYRSN